MPFIGSLHARLQLLRDEAEARLELLRKTPAIANLPDTHKKKCQLLNNVRGPNVLVIGEGARGAGPKTASLLVNYALRCGGRPLLIDLDVDADEETGDNLGKYNLII